MSNPFLRLKDWLLYGNRGNNLLYAIFGTVAVAIIVTLIAMGFWF